ncbi:MAG TPA: hypothetical protein VF316_13965 [Polyangiaceae bacterium]
MRGVVLGATTLLSCAVFEPSPAEPPKPPPPDECSSSPAYVAPAEAAREIPVTLSGNFGDVMTLQRISLCVDGALFWEIKGNLDTKVENSLRLAPGPHALLLIAHATRTTASHRYWFDVRSPHALAASDVTSLGVDLFLGGDATRPINERPRVRWDEGPGEGDAGDSDR